MSVRILFGSIRGFPMWGNLGFVGVGEVRFCSFFWGLGHLVRGKHCALTEGPIIIEIYSPDARVCRD